MRFNSKAEIVVSSDMSSDVWNLIQEEKSQKVGLILDSNIADLDDVQKLVRFLESKTKTCVYKLKITEPTTNMVNEHAANLKKENIDLFVSIGGGSTLDLTKALSVMVVHDKPVEEYHGTGKPFERGVTKILIPTTAGTGAEVTPGAVLVNPAKKFKRAIGGKYVMPNYALLNARLTASMPDNVTASTGLDALGHAVESYTAKCANLITRMYSKQAFALIYNNLPKVFDAKNDLKLRENVLLGSCLAGYAIYNSNTGAAHSISYAMGIYHEIPHGLAIARLLPPIVKINVEKGCDLYADLYDLIENSDKNLDRKNKAKKFAAALADYRPLSYLDKNIGNYGVNNENVGFLAERGLDLEPALKSNPVDFGLEDSKKVLKGLL